MLDARAISGEKFKPETPGSSPWVTAVGGTTGSKKEQVSAWGLVSSRAVWKRKLLIET